MRVAEKCHYYMIMLAVDITGVIMMIDNLKLLYMCIYIICEYMFNVWFCNLLCNFNVTCYCTFWNNKNTLSMHISIDKWRCYHQRTCTICVYSHVLHQIHILHLQQHAMWDQTSYPLCPWSFLQHSNKVQLVLREKIYIYTCVNWPHCCSHVFHKQWHTIPLLQFSFLHSYQNATMEDVNATKNECTHLSIQHEQCKFVRFWSRG